MIHHGIVLDTETTGLDPKQGHRVVEIACIEIANLMPTGNVYHVYINPERDMPDEAYRVHGLSYEFLRQHPVFSQHIDDFLAFIDNKPLIIHNAPFDLKFLKHHVAQLRPRHRWDNVIVDTLALTRKKFPGSPATLDALCKRFDISLSNRAKHNALVDTQLLAQVYLNLCDGKNLSFLAPTDAPQKILENIPQERSIAHMRPIPLPTRWNTEDIAAHDDCLPPRLKAWADRVKNAHAQP